MNRRNVLAGVEDWPIVWRVTAPACGSYDHDFVMVETEDHDDALKKFRELRRGGWPVRLERLHCGPLPDDYGDTLPKLRDRNAQTPGTEMRSC